MPNEMTINVDLDSKCAECGKGGSCANGLCLGCTAKALAGKPMKSKVGKAVQDKINRDLTGRRMGKEKKKV
jgi:hypothetical protein